MQTSGTGSCTERAAHETSDVFYHPDGERGRARQRRELRAKAICAACPVLESCRKHALAVAEPYGVWGGLSESERLVILRNNERKQPVAV